MPRRTLDNPWVRSGLVLLSLALLIAFLVRTSHILTPFLLAFIAAYVLDPVVDRLETVRFPFTQWHLPRSAAVGVVFVSALVLLMLVVLLIIPTMVEQIGQLGAKVAAFKQNQLPLLIPKIEAAIGMQLPRDTSQLLSRLTAHAEMLGGVSQRLLTPASQLLQQTVGGVFGFFLTVLNLVLAPVLAFYLVNDIDRIREASKDFVPFRYRNWLFARMTDVDRVLASFIRGQLTVCLILGTLYSAGLGLLGLPLWIVVGFLSGFGNIVPYVGTLVGLVLSLLLMLLEHPDAFHLGGVVVVYAVVQTLEGTVISPKVVGETVGVHPVMVMLAILLGGEFFGFLGVLLAVPATAAGSVFWRDVVARYRQSDFFGVAGERTPHPPASPPPQPPLPLDPLPQASESVIDSQPVELDISDELEPADLPNFDTRPGLNPVLLMPESAGDSEDFR